jgi:hypothetical protein
LFRLFGATAEALEGLLQFLDASLLLAGRVRHLRNGLLIELSCDLVPERVEENQLVSLKKVTLSSV